MGTEQSDVNRTVNKHCWIKFVLTAGRMGWMELVDVKVSRDIPWINHIDRLRVKYNFMDLVNRFIKKSQLLTNVLSPIIFFSIIIKHS